jgi:MoaA/NifB/PqqE/SkfB family radical SAM enzyme
MTHRFVLRDERFGATLYDKKMLKHTFLNKDELKEELSVKGTQVDEYKHKVADLSKARDDILYSPIRVYFDMTTACNLRCKTCFNESGFKSNDELTNEEAKLSLEGLAKDNVFDIRFSGGELTQRPDWFDIVAKAKDLGFGVSMNTNGVYNDEKIIPQLQELDINEVTLSIDGDKQLHEYIRGNGTHDKVMATIKELHKRGITTRLNSIITRNSKDSLEFLLNTADKYAREIAFFYFRPIGRAAKNLMHLLIPYKELVEFDDLVDQMKTKYPNTNVVHREHTIAENSTVYNHVGLYIGATDGFTRFNILQNGDLVAGGYTSFIDKAWILGNIKDEGYSLLNVWQNSTKLDEFRALSKDVIESCKNCDEKANNCGGEGIELALYKQKYGCLPYCKYSNAQQKVVNYG